MCLDLWLSAWCINIPPFSSFSAIFPACLSVSLCAQGAGHYSAVGYTNRSDCNGFRGARFHPVTFSCSASPAALSDGDTVKIISLAPTVTLRADHTAVQIEGEIRRASLLPSSSLPPLSRSLIAHCGSSLHLALLRIPSLPLCLSFSLSPSLLHSPLNLPA